MKLALTLALVIYSLATASPAPSRAPTARSLALTVQTVPALAGIEITAYTPCTLFVARGETPLEPCLPEPLPHLQSWSAVTSADGVARLTLPDTGLYTVQISAIQLREPDLSAEFSRWQETVFTNQRQVRLHGDRTLTVGLSTRRPVRLDFSGVAGELVPAERIGYVELRSSLGSVHRLQGSGPHWLPAEHILNRDAGLESVPIVYALQDVELDGSNVINRGQQRFSATAGETDWPIETLLFSADLVARDALFGSPVGTGVQLEFPNGASRTYPYEARTGVHVTQLARGTYRVSGAGASGIALPTIMVLSRDQQIQAVVITWLDLAVVGGAGLLLAVGLFLIGRPHWLPARLRPGDADRSETLKSRQ